MRYFLRHIPVAVLLTVLAVLAPVAAQSLAVDVINSRRELSGRIWGSGNWMAFTVDEEERDLNGDGDLRDTILCLMDLRTGTVQETGLAVDYSLADSDEDWPIAFNGDQMVIQVSESENGGKDLNNNGSNRDDVLALYNPRTRQVEYLGVTGRFPVFLGTKIYFAQPEGAARKDLNGDGDLRDNVLCSYDTTTRQLECLGMETGPGFQVAGDWIATPTSEAGQFARDLNSDGDLNDTVAQVYQISAKKWTNTGLQVSHEVGMALTPKLLAVVTSEAAQGNRDLNGDKDTKDLVCQVWDFATGQVINTGLDASGGVGADGDMVGFAVSEAAQGDVDLNMDKDTQDVVAHCFSLKTRKALSLRVDASGGLVVSGGKIAVSCSEADQGNTDLNKDRDSDDYVMLVYDPATNKITNTNIAVDGDPVAKEGTLAWKVLEADQGDRDLNRDGDTDDMVLCLMNLANNSTAVTSWAVSDYICPTSRGVGFSTLEEDQGSRDLNGDQDTDDDVMQVARKRQ